MLGGQLALLQSLWYATSDPIHLRIPERALYRVQVRRRLITGRRETTSAGRPRVYEARGLQPGLSTLTETAHERATEEGRYLVKGYVCAHCEAFVCAMLYLGMGRYAKKRLW